ncbi:hypothetical protein F4808DRAFT_25480 [Astrocystis sublimbata]|nr:hypothetical protein F4808DRAFT_25480 [Astrocystis sublimbata]
MAQQGGTDNPQGVAPPAWARASTRQYATSQPQHKESNEKDGLLLTTQECEGDTHTHTHTSNCQSPSDQGLELDEKPSSESRNSQTEDSEWVMVEDLDWELGRHKDPNEAFSHRFELTVGWGRCKHTVLSGEMTVTRSHEDHSQCCHREGHKIETP